MKGITCALQVYILLLFHSALVGGPQFFDFTSNANTGSLEIKCGTAWSSPEGLLVEASPDEAIELIFKGKWDFSEWVYLTWDIDYQSAVEAPFNISIEGQSQHVPWGAKKFSQIHSGFLKNKENRYFNCTLTRSYNSRRSNKLVQDFSSMNSYPNGICFNHHGIIPDGVEIVTFQMDPHPKRRKFLIRNIFLNRPAKHPLYIISAEKFYPFIDRYGQFKHSNWPGKIIQDSDFKESFQEEDNFLRKFPIASNLTRYGGYKNGPRLKATGHFRVDQHGGSWTLVDPDGYLFLSTGINFVGHILARTEVKKRSNYFEGLPSENSRFRSCFSREDQYFNHGKANLIRKYGQLYENPYIKRNLKRLKHWGFNTLGGWSIDNFSNVPESLRLPYTLNLNVTWKLPQPLINTKMMDVFDPRWREQLEEEFSDYSEKVKDDPWLVGAFVNNELHWEKPNEFALSLLRVNQSIPGKKRYIMRLKEKLETIENFNEILGTNLKDWDALLQHSLPDTVLSLNTLETLNEAHYREMVEYYFSTIRIMFDQYMPEVLYLGCRFHSGYTHEFNLPIAAKYVDVLSVNIYNNDVGDYRYTNGFEEINLPYLVSEFHFGALDRGMFGTGLNLASDQRNRGERYRIYMDSVLADPKCIGAHWFMMADEATAGFNDNESYNCGFLSVTDQPYYDFLKEVIPYNNNLYRKQIDVANKETLKDSSVPKMLQD